MARPLIALTSNPLARVELVCLLCDHRRRAHIMPVLSWMRRKGVRRLEWMTGKDVAEQIGDFVHCPDCGKTWWSSHALLLPAEPHPARWQFHGPRITRT